MRLFGETGWSGGFEDTIDIARIRWAHLVCGFMVLGSFFLDYFLWLFMLAANFAFGFLVFVMLVVSVVFAVLVGLAVLVLRRRDGLWTTHLFFPEPLPQPPQLKLGILCHRR